MVQQSQEKHTKHGTNLMLWTFKLIAHILAVLSIAIGVLWIDDYRMNGYEIVVISLLLDIAIKNQRGKLSNVQ